LPLESRDRDSSGEVIIVEEGGAVSFFALLGLGLLAAARNRVKWINTLK